MLRRAIVFVPHHPLHLTGRGAIQGGIGGRRMPQTMDHDPGMFRLGQQQALRDYPLNAPRPQVRMHTDKTTQMVGEVQKGDRIEVKMNDQNHALSIRSLPKPDAGHGNKEGRNSLGSKN